MTTAIRVLVTFALFLAVSAAAAAQETLQEKLDVNLVLVDATVTDRDGNQILGLTKDDFIVEENGVRQDIASVDYFTSRRLLDSTEGNAAFPVERVKEERYLIFFFQNPTGDERSSVMSELLFAKKAAIDFVKKQMLPTDRIAVVGHDVRLKVFTDFTADEKRLIKAIDEAITFSSGTTTPPADGEPSILRAIHRDRMINKTGRVYDALSLLGDSVRSIRGRKVVVLFSAGMGELSASNRNFAENEQSFIKDAIRSLNASNVTVNGVYLRRNVAYSAIEDALSQISLETGGNYYRNIVSFASPLKQIQRENAGYYLISYYPAARKESSGFQKIDVSLKNSEFRVKARPGYSY